MAARRTGDCSTTRRGRLTRKEILTKYVLLNPYIWLFRFAMCWSMWFGRRSTTGAIVYVRDAGRRSGHGEYGSDNVELGGFIGALVAGWGSDKLFTATAGR